MKYKRFVQAALIGLSLVVVQTELHAGSEKLRVVRKDTNSTLEVAINRAVVVESDVPFAELSIANADIADITSLSDRSIYVLGRTPGLTTMTILDAAGKLISNVDIRVSADLSEFKERLRQILPGEKIEARTANDGIVLSGTVSSATKLQAALELAERYAPQRVSNLMSVGGVQQVMLKVRFAEMRRTVSKSLTASLSLGNPTSASPKLGSNVAASAGGFANVANGTLQSATTNVGAFGFGANVGNVEIGMLLEALESKGMVRTLAEPNLTALSGQEASFLAGGEYPVPVAQDGGQVSVEFKPFGIEMKFTPRVLDGGLINLEMKAAVSAVDPTKGFTAGTFTIDAFTRRETSTTVEMRDGESFAVAGLLQEDFTDLNAQVPWLGDIPVLGALFRSAEYRRDQSELVIIVTPHLVTPTRGEALALPTDRIRPPSEKDLFLFGRTVDGSRKKKGAVAEVSSQDFNGSYGYVME